MDKSTLRVLRIIPGTIVDGPGLRLSIYLAGCPHHCEGCHNPQSWDHEGGTEMSVREIMDIIDYNDMSVTLTGGDPLMQYEGVIELCREIKKRDKTIWLYTGYTIEQIKKESKYAPLLEGLVDVIVDGRYVERLRDPTLPFRGSSNQRIIEIDNIVNNKTQKK